MTLPVWAPRVAVAAVLAALAGWAFAVHWSVLAASPFPLGIDGYFYPIQVRSLLEHGTLAYPSSPLAFWWMAPFAAATDPIVGAKLGAALGAALIALPAYGVGKRLGKDAVAGLVAAGLATTSAGAAYLTIEFVKQGLGLTVALTAIWLILRAARLPSRRRLGAAAVAIAAALATHKIAGALTVVIAIPAAFAEARGRGVLRGRRLLYLLVAAVAGAGVALGLGLASPQRFLSPADLALVSELFTTHARWDAPALAVPQLTLALDHEAAIGAVLGLAAVLILVARRVRLGSPSRRSPAERAASSTIAVIAFALGLPWLAVTDPEGLGFRLRIAAFVPMALCAAIVAGTVLAWLDATIELWQPRPRLGALARAVARVAIAAAVLLGHPPAEHVEGRVLTHPALVSAALALRGRLPATATVIVPERHIAFMVAWYARATVALRPESVPYAQRMRLMPLAFIGAGSPLDDALDAARRDPSVVPPIGLHPRHRNGLVLVTEPTWDWLLARMPDRARHHFAAWPTI